ncbi:hypothetical protein E1287_38715 [Actinomadura sp. KC06]|uniref:hypothetical protein n=1 Tax=Actinomadura sp. KC06 TaxID=2530369 RepID=UPI001053CECD|nr:hypothetical protein [Actinomadura sp. KC06]TDD23769.1 hypothetical protein E1287_38715 [Actinomadura sp. KC06]
MTVDRDGTAARIDRPAAPADEEPPPPPDRPGAEGSPSRAASRAAARASDRPGAPEPPGGADLPGPRVAPDDDWREPADEAESGDRVPDPPSQRPARAVDRPLFPTVTDHSGYMFSEREFAFAGVSPEQVWDMRMHRAPLGMRPEQWDECVVELRAALAYDGFGDAEVRLQGPGARFCSQDPRKWFPQSESELRARVIQRHRGASDDERLRRADAAVAKYRAAGFSQERPKPITAFFDSMYALDAACEPDAYEFQITGQSLAGRFHDGEQNTPDPQQVAPALRGWVRRWEGATGRGVSLSIADRHHAGAGLREDDWMVIGPEDERRGEK